MSPARILPRSRRTVRSSAVLACSISVVPSRKRERPASPRRGGAGFALAPRRLKRPVRRLRITASPKCGSSAGCRLLLWFPPDTQWQITTESGNQPRRHRWTVPYVAYAEAVHPASTPLIDPFGRRVTDLRVSITDRCNLRCTYCMPAEGMEWLARDELLTYEEQARIVRVCVERYGFDSVRITGGEPHGAGAHHRGSSAMLAPLGVDIAHDHERREARRGGARPRRGGPDAGSTCRSTRCARTSSPSSPGATTSHRVLAGIDAALDAGLQPVKINCVVMRGVNDDEVVDLAAFGRETGRRRALHRVHAARRRWRLERRPASSRASEILERINAVFPLERPARAGASSDEHIEPAERFRYADGIGDVGVIASVTEPFCDNCDRIRVTAEGKLRTCLFALDEFDLRAILRDGGDPDDARRPARGRDRACRGHEVGRAPDRPGRLHPSRAGR